MTGRSTMARFTGHGQRLGVETRRPDLLITAVDRAVAALGAGTSNRVGRAITGSRRVAPDPTIQPSDRS